MKRGEPPKRKTPLKRSTKPIKRTEIKRKPKKERERVPTEVRLYPRKNRGTPDHPDFEYAKDIVKARSGLICEVGVVCGGRGRHENTHHRKLRRHGDHRPCNLLGVCFMCHDWIHGHPRDAHALGMLCWSWEEPADVWVIVNGRKWVVGDRGLTPSPGYDKL